MEFKVTLVWTDPPPGLLSKKTLVNDLDLKVIENNKISYPNGYRSLRFK